MDEHMKLGHSEAYGWKVDLKCWECGREAQGNYGIIVDGKHKPICDICGCSEVYEPDESE